MKPSLLLLGSLCLTLPACFIPDPGDDPDYGPGCSGPYWDDVEVGHVELGRAGDRNLVYWQRGRIGQAAVLDDGGVPDVGDRDTALSGEAVLISSGSGYLQLRVDTQALEVLGQRVDADGVPIGEALVLGDSGSSAPPRGFFDGERYWVIWRGAGSGEDGTVSVVRVGLDGALLDAEPISLATGPASSVDIAGNGDRFWAVWALDDTVAGVRLDREGTVLDDEPWALLGADTVGPRLAARGDEVLLVGRSTTAGQPRRVQRLGPDGPLSEAAPLGGGLGGSGINEVRELIADPTRDGYLLVAGVDGGVWTFPCADCRIEVRRLDVDGTATDDGPLAAFDGASPAVTFNGVHLLAAYLTYTVDAGNLGAWHLQTRAIYLDGAVGDAIPLDAGEVAWVDDDCDD